MNSIKVSELFYSIQGEGRYMGVPSVFLRTFGCNFTCDGFNMPRGEKTNERHSINAKLYKSYKDLPLVTTGCDSYASWDPKFKHLSPVLKIDSIAQAIVDTLPHKEWRDEHLVITGGEPLLGWQKAYPKLLSHPLMKNLKEITFETNGTQKLGTELVDYLYDWAEGDPFSTRSYESITFSVSAKLPASGEKWEEAIIPENILQYQESGHVYLKFVVATEKDIEDAERADEEFRRAGFRGNTYIMPVGGVDSVYNLNAKNVALAAMKRGWRYSDRLQVPLFKNEWGT
jgi:7-carboxy-7-deazaguanine synthase